MTPRLGRRARHDRGDKERVSAEGLNFEHLVRLLYNFPEADGFLQLLFPLVPRLCRFSVESPETTQSTVMMDGTWVHCTRVSRRFWTRGGTETRRVGIVLFATKPRPQKTGVASSRLIREVGQREEIERNRLCGTSEGAHFENTR